MSIQDRIDMLENQLENAYEMENATGENWKTNEIAEEIERLRKMIGA